MRTWLPALVAGSLALAACNADDTTDALCDHVEAVAASHDELARTLPDEPEPSDLAEPYRDLAARYGDVASALDDLEASAETAELASLFGRGAEVLEAHEPLDGERLEQLFAESDTLVALRARLAGEQPMGFSPPAWDEIDDRCEIPVDPRADG